MRITILLVCHHMMIREGIRRLLDASNDVTVLGEAASDREAVRQIELLKPEVVVLDPSGPGLNLMAVASALPGRCRMVLLSSQFSTESVFHGLRAGARGFVAKSGPFVELIRAIRAVRDGGRYFCPEVTPLVNHYRRMRAPKSPYESLTLREHQVLKLVAEGSTSSEIADALGLSPKTVETYRSRLMRKLNIFDVASLVKFAIRQGVIDLT